VGKGDVIENTRYIDALITSLDKHPQAIENGGKGIFRARARAHATSQPIIRDRHYVRMRALSRSLPLPLSLSLSPRSITLLPSSLLAQPLFFSSFSLFLSFSSLFLSGFPLISYPSRYTCTSGPRETEGKRERLARNPPQNKRAPRRVVSRRSRSRAAQRAPTLPCIFNYRLVTESLD